ncbi:MULTISPECIES: cation-transporting P-type ATPase [unclassified Guyparkeria]|uniref:cation-translocating P-type ATPase n=1 Tax=unclassified Guyparkeria TaxID=2626246 RepID=UPI0007336A56|nr:MULTISPECIES: cation-transporting P-type ATPase [unclassified Guyparkeria]KTG17494.1 ATPase [Guyparkeria sp. XI15]OAE88309.1 ATPase [Guyparkeria sp. WRN-7]
MPRHDGHPDAVKPAHRQPVDAVLAQQATSLENGLTAGEVRARRHRHGPNRLPEARGPSVWRLLLNQVESLVVILLFSAAVAAAAFGSTIEAIAILAALVVNTVVGFAMEWRASRAMEALQRMSTAQVHVRRDGKTHRIGADQLVPGDIVLLEAGDVIMADLRLVESNRLQCNESALTGESTAVDKITEPLPEGNPPIADRRNMGYAGTAVTQGSGTGVVVATGLATELGAIARLVAESGKSITPLEKRLDRLGQRLIWLTLVVAALVAGAGMLAGTDLRLMVETAIAMAIAAVPEGLPVVATLALAQGMLRMASRNALVKRLSAVETLGAANVIFTDKTGTLTQNHMTLSRLALDRGVIELHDDEPRLGDTPLDPQGTPDLAALLETATLCNNASLESHGAVGDPTEVALLEAANRTGITRSELLDALPETREVSFDPAVNMMATYHAAADGFRVAVKGAPESVIEACTRVLTADGERNLDESDRRDWMQRSESLAADGLRTLMLAQKSVDDESGNPYEGLTLLGVAGLYDPPRKGIRETIAACQEAGIRLVMVTGDHDATARAVAREVGIADADAPPADPATLDRLGALTTAEREALLAQGVFARISPQQKLELIQLYQEAGWVVGMIGDGVNDAPGLKKADIGIAMGQRGTEVAREAADMVLKDDAFATIVDAVRHGRTIFQNIRRFIVYLLSGNLGEILAISAAAMVAAPLPMLPLQILYINFVSDVMPALALGLNRSEAGIMDRPPRDPAEPILMRRHWSAIGGYAVIIAATALAAFAVALLVLELDTAMAVTISFLTFGFARLWHVFNMRSSRSPLLLNEVTSNGFVWAAIGVGVLLLLVATYLAPLADILGVTPPGAREWLLILGFSVLPLLIVQSLKHAGLWWERPPHPDTRDD